MSAAPIHPDPTEYAGLRMNADQFLGLGETAERLTLIDGVVTVSPRPTFMHQRISYLIANQIDQWCKGRPGARFVQDVDLQLSATLVYQPDIVAFVPGKVQRNPAKLDFPPDLVVEVISPGSRSMDLITKRDDYEAFGVPEYWVVDPVAITVRAWQRQGLKFVEAAAESDRVPSLSLPGFTLDLASLRKDESR